MPWFQIAKKSRGLFTYKAIPTVKGKNAFFKKKLLRNKRQWGEGGVRCIWS